MQQFLKRKGFWSIAAATFIMPSAASAVEITDYTFPDSQYQEAYLRSNFSSQSGNQDQTSYNYAVSGDYENFFSSQMRTWRLRLDGQANGDRGPNDIDRLEDSGFATAFGVVDNYLQDDNRWFWFGSGEAGYQSEAEESFFKVGAGIGYGRIYNATPLARVMRVVEELSEANVLTGGVGDATYLDLAKIVDREREFRSKYGEVEYKSHWFDAMEEVMNRDNILRDKRLGAGGALDMDRVLVDEKFSARRHGWLVRAGVGLVVQDYSGETDNDPSLDVTWEYAKPNGHRGQFDNTMSYSTVFANDTDQIARNSMSYSYEVSDRVDWVNKWDLTYSIPGNNRLEETFNNVLTSGFDYYLTNLLTAGLQLTLQRVDDGISRNGNDETEFLTAFSIRYRFL